MIKLFAHGRWFSPGTPASSTTKTGRHDIAEILLKVALKHKKSNQINQQTIGIPVGLNCAQLLADLFLHVYEAD